LTRLANRDIELIYYDHRGHGRSVRPQGFEGIGVDTWADDAEALRKYLGHERIILYGHSFGGFIAQEYALRYRDHLDGLILDSSIPALDYSDVIIANAKAWGTEEQVQMLIKAFTEPMTDDIAMRQGHKTILPLYFNNYNPEIGEAMNEKMIYNAAAFNHGNRCFLNYNTLSRLHEIKVPTLITAGRHDFITPPAQGAERLHKLIPNSKLVIFEDSGHFPFVEEQEKFLNVAADWAAGS
jgi:proline iminopeptidase